MRVQKSRSARRNFLILAILLVTCGAYVAFVEINSMIFGILRSEAQAPLVIYTETVPLLTEHTHHNLDSIVDLGHGKIVGTEGGLYVLDRDVWVTGYTWEIENAPPSTLHHLVLWRDDTPAVLCPNGATSKEELFTIGSDFFSNEFSFPDGYAIFLRKGTPLNLEVMLHNPEPPFGPGGVYKNVRMKLSLRLGSPEKTYKPLHILRLSVEDPACTSRSGTFDVPARVQGYEKRIVTPMSTYTFKKDATVVLAFGHTHPWAGGRTIRFFLNDMPVLELTPKQSDKHLWSWYTPGKYPHIDVKEGDTISMTAVYENPYDEPLIHEAMGMMLIGFSE